MLISIGLCRRFTVNLGRAAEDDDANDCHSRSCSRKGHLCCFLFLTCFLNVASLKNSDLCAITPHAPFWIVTEKLVHTQCGRFLSYIFGFVSISTCIFTPEMNNH